jgi:hypothetical protein
VPQAADLIERASETMLDLQAGGFSPCSFAATCLSESLAMGFGEARGPRPQGELPSEVRSGGSTKRGPGGCAAARHCPLAEPAEDLRVGGAR